MARIDIKLAGSANMLAFLDALAFSEIGPELLKVSDDGYNAVVGSTPEHPILFRSYDFHPRAFQANMNSDAAGRYQFMGKYWKYYRDGIPLLDFGPASQDRWAIVLIGECHAVDLVHGGHFDDAINACRSRWASLPGAGYGQHENKIADLRAAYLRAGGTLASPPPTTGDSHA